MSLLARHQLPLIIRQLLLMTTCWAIADLSLSAETEVIEMKSGHRVEGEVLKEQGDILFVDVGVDVIRIPTSQVRHRAPKQEGTGEKPSLVDKQKLYQTAVLPRRSIREQAERFGEAVVLIQTPSGLGSGFIISESGMCVTNTHVVEKETRVAVTIYHRTTDGEFQRIRVDDIKIVAINPFFDLALLQIPPQKDLTLKTVFLAREDETPEGEEVFAIGNPLGLERTVSQGIISTRNRNVKGLLYLQTTAEINPGNSGGPLFNSRGEVVGVINMKLMFAEGVGFAIPTPYLKLFLQNHEAYAFDRNNPNTGYRYIDPPRRKNAAPPPSQ